MDPSKHSWSSIWRRSALPGWERRAAGIAAGVSPHSDGAEDGWFIRITYADSAEQGCAFPHSRQPATHARGCFRLPLICKCVRCTKTEVWLREELSSCSRGSAWPCFPCANSGFMTVAWGVGNHLRIGDAGGHCAVSSRSILWSTSARTGRGFPRAASCIARFTMGNTRRLLDASCVLPVRADGGGFRPRHF